MSQVDCTIQSNENFARCLLRDNTTFKTQISIILIMVIMLGIAGISIKNILALRDSNEKGNLKGILRLNLIILGFLIVRLSFYFDSVLQLMGTGYPLYVYQIIQNVSIIIFNSLFTIGAYYWCKMLLLSSIEKEKVRRKISWLICILIQLINTLAIIIQAIYFIMHRIEDNDCPTNYWKNGCAAEFSLSGEKLPMIMIIASSSCSGAFFCITSLLVSIQLRNINWLPKEIYQKIQRLSIACIIVTAIRIIQDFIQVPDTNIIADLKTESQINDSYAWPIYSFFYLFTTDVCATLLFVLIFAPRGETQDVITPLSSVISNESPLLHDDIEKINPESNEKDQFNLISESGALIYSPNSKNENISPQSSDTEARTEKEKPQT